MDLNIGSKIKALRLASDLTQEELANRARLTKGFISQLENEKFQTSISLDSLADILDALGVSLSEFFGDTDDPFESVAHGSNLDDDLGAPDGGQLGDGQLAAFAPPGAVAGPAVAEPAYEVDDALEEALEEADFFVSQDLFDDALSLLEEQIPRYPGHPLLIERMQSVRAAMRGKQGG